MSYKLRLYLAMIVGFMVAFAAPEGRADDATDSARDSIIQGVRDDVRRKIRNDQAARTENSQPRKVRQRSRTAKQKSSK